MQATPEVIEKTVAALKAHDIEAHVVEKISDLIPSILPTIPKGAEVFTISSETLRLSGLAYAINESGDYDSVRNRLNTETNKLKKRKLGCAPDYAIGSAQALTEDGHLWIVSATGSQLAACAYGAEYVIYIVGAQKIVEHDVAAMKRIYETALPLESARTQKIYGTDSKIGKILKIIDDKPGRTTVYIVKEEIGY